MTGPTRPKSSLLRVFLRSAVLGLVLGGVVGGTVRYHVVQDWWRLRGYTPPAAVLKLAEDDTMTTYTRHLFYLNRPQLSADVKTFRKHCPENKDTVVLGCYHSDQNGIFVYDIRDTKLAGVTQVTAAHEVLHAAYGRLSSKQKTQLNTELRDFYLHSLTDQRLKDEVAIYQKTEPKAVMEEMSCLFGTELESLPANLESYYAKFFTNRQKIVAYGTHYQSEFSSRQQQIKDDDTQLSDLKKQITAERASLDALSSVIDAKRTQMDGLLSASRGAEYNAQVPGFNAKVGEYNAAIAKLQTNIDSYNQLVTTRNDIAGQLTTLTVSLDTRLPVSK